jgi:SAM-dependent methyltransferase
MFKEMNLDTMRYPGFLEKAIQIEKEGIENVENKNGWYHVDKCPLCNSMKRKTEFVKLGIAIVCCLECSLRYAGRFPVNTEDVYSDGKYQEAVVNIYMKNHAFKMENFGKERIELIRQHIDKPNESKLLDIGCGTGWFLELSKKYGFDVSGQELSKHMAQWTSERLNISIMNLPIDKLSTSIKYDVITMFDVLEHVKDPMKIILKCRSLLNYNGIIVIFTLNFDSLSVHIMKEYSNIIAPPAHLTFFNKRSVQLLSEKSGLELIYYRTCGIDIGDLKAFYEWKKENEMALACKKLYDIIQPVVDEAEAGNHIRLILKKRN